MGRTQNFLCPSAIWSLAGIQIPPLQSLMGKVWVVLIVAQARLMRWAGSAAPPCRLAREQRVTRLTGSPPVRNELDPVSLSPSRLLPDPCAKAQT